jgi:CheY-like chemotaxis protein
MIDDWDEDDGFLLDDEDDGFLEDDTPSSSEPPWIILIIDDEPGVHDITKLALQRFSFEGRGLDILSAFSAKEGREVLNNRDDVAMILLDVVMETDHAGLDLARQIRDDLDNDDVRIVLRTGQPGMAPEEDVILAFDINDYRAKTELTSQRLFTTVVNALRSYRDIKTLQTYQQNAYDLLGDNTATIQALIDKSEQPLLQVGNQLDIQRCNQAFANLISKNTNEVIGLSLSEISALSFEEKDSDLRVSIGETKLILQTVLREDGSIICYTGSTQ